MKRKLITILLALLLAITPLFAVACGGTENSGGSGGTSDEKSIFDGNFKEVTKEEAQLFIASVVETDNIEIVSKGFKLDFQYEANVIKGDNSAKMNLAYDAKSSLVDDKVQMATKSEYVFDSKGLSESEVVNTLSFGGANFELYILNNNCYIKYGIAEQRAFETLEELQMVFKVYFEPVDEFVFYLDFLNANFENQDVNMKCCIDENEDYSKIKFEVKMEQGEEANEVFVEYIYDENKSLIAYQMELSSVGISYEGFDYNISASLTFEPYSGEIEFPNDLDTYVKV